MALPEDNKLVELAPSAQLANISLLDVKPTCPNVIFVHEGDKYSLPAEKIDIKISFELCTAFVVLDCVFRNINDIPVDCLFLLPMKGTVTSVSVEIGNRRIQTQIIPTKDLRLTKHKVHDGDEEEQNNYEEYVPNMYRLPIRQVDPNYSVKITCHYFEHLKWIDGKFWFDIPLEFHKGSIIDSVPNELSLEEVMSISCNIQGMKSDIKVTSSYEIVSEKHPDGMHQYLFGRVTDPNTSVCLDGADVRFGDKIGRNFMFRYSLNNEEVSGIVLHQYNEEGGGDFVMFVAPPCKREQIQKTFPRAFFFLLDRSGSMAGGPYEEAVHCLERALENLPDHDYFTVCVFDHHAVYFKQDLGLVQATPNNVLECKNWIADYHPQKGGTNIKKPLLHAVSIMEEQNILPFIVLITDGCVEDEREIINKISGHIENVRILTLGLGRFCNWYFLKRLSTEGRGFSEVVIYKENIKAIMTHLLNKCDLPVLVNVSIGLRNVDYYPYPIPDLFYGQPLLIAGSYRGDTPKRWQVSGQGPITNKSGKTKHMLDLPVVNNPNISVKNILIKNKLDLLTAEAWFKQSTRLEEKVINLSISQSIPSAHTTMVAVDFSQEDAQNETKEFVNPTTALAAVGAGGAIAVGAMMFSFGDLDATIENFEMGDIGGAFAEGCCVECGELDCDNCCIYEICELVCSCFL